MPLNPDELMDSWQPRDVKLAPDGMSSESKQLIKPKPAKPTPLPVEGTYYLEPSYNEHYNNWKSDPSPSSSGSLLKAVDPVINEALRTYGGSAQKSPTLRSKARLMALKAIEGYDPTKAKLRTHLLSQMQGLRRLAAKEDQILNIPEQVLLDLGNLKESENRLRDKLSRDPSDMELSDFLGISRKRISYLRTMKPSFAEGKLLSTDEEGSSSLNQPGVKSVDNDKALTAWQEFVYHDLDPIDQQIMEHTLGMNKKPVLSNQEVAKMLRLSPGAISQRKAKIQNKLDMSEDTGLFG